MCSFAVEGVVAAHSHTQGAHVAADLIDGDEAGSFPHTGSSHFLTRRDARQQPEKYSVPRIEMSKRFLAYGDHTPIRA